MASVSITGITKLTIVRLTNMSNEGTWLELHDRENEVAWITIWIPPLQLAEQLELAALAIRESALQNKPIRVIIEEMKDAPIIETKAS